MTTPFRAGLLPGEQASQMAAHAIAHPQVDLNSVVRAADISEYQWDIADAAYLAWSQAIIIRAAYGAQHDDRAWYGGQRRDLLHAGGARFLGIYQYVTSFEDAATQARALVRLLGSLRPGEKIIADIEEGSGNLSANWQAWAQVIRDGLGDSPWLYSGLNFAAVHGLAPVNWVAAYGPTEPSAPHRLWQFSSSYPIPGVGTGDCSLFHGSMDDLASLAYSGTVTLNWTEKLVQTLPTLSQGATGEDVKTLQGALAARGYTLVKADGIFGPDTAGALRSFQTSRHLTADGIVGPATWPKLLNR